MLELAATCLAMNIYWEARFEPVAGQFAVAYVTINRAHGEQDKVCHEVYKKKQFSWTNHAFDKKGKLLAEYEPKGKRWEISKAIAHTALTTNADFTLGATHYHANYIATPEWAYGMRHVATYGKHIFYKKNG